MVYNLIRMFEARLSRSIYQFQSLSSFFLSTRTPTGTLMDFQSLLPSDTPKHSIPSISTPNFIFSSKTASADTERYPGMATADYYSASVKQIRYPYWHPSNYKRNPGHYCWPFPILPSIWERFEPQS